jgi:hypothetical protein
MQDFIIGCLTMLSLIAILYKAKKRIRLKKIGFRQSILHGITKNIMPTNAELYKKKSTQSKIYSKRQTIRVIQTPDNLAYWVDQNTFYCADVQDGGFDPSMGKPVDTSNMSRQQIDNLMVILDNLKKD